MIDCNGCYLNKLYESNDERLKCLHRQTCERAYQQGRAEAIDEFVKEIKKSDRYKYVNENNVMKLLRFEEEIEQIAEQLKEQNE